MKRKDAITHSAITSKKNPETKRLLSNFIRFTLSSLLSNVAMQRE
jgi:hypothetical protein